MLWRNRIWTVATPTYPEYVAETAARLPVSSFAQLSSGMRETLERQIPELAGDPRAMELLGPSVEGDVETLLNALRYAIPVDLVAVPVAAMEYARRLAQYGIPLNALVRAYRLGQHVMNELVFAEVRAGNRHPRPGEIHSAGSDQRDAVSVHRLDHPAGRRRL